jgi:hypothetical protein
MTDQTYNGWTNYATWTNCATWRVNQEMVDGLDPRDFFPDCEDIMELRDAIKQYCEEHIQKLSKEGLARNYALAFLDEVDWLQIAEHVAEVYELFEGDTT